MGRRRLIVTLGVLALSLPGCDRGVEKCEPAGGFIGLSEEEARDLADRKNVTVRVLSEGAIATADLRADRVNLSFDGGSVKTATYC